MDIGQGFHMDAMVWFLRCGGLEFGDALLMILDVDSAIPKYAPESKVG